jgi:TusA-related sulfurtransferase
MLQIHADHELDISTETCPMTYVRTRLALDALQPGQVLAVRLRGADPETNVPKSAEQQGHTVLATVHETDGTTRIWLRRA